MKTQFYGAISLDGFLADAHHSIDWLLQFGEPPEASYAAFVRQVGAIAMGSTTYEWILAHDQSAREVWPYAQPTWVFSSRELPSVAGADIRFVRDDARPVHAAMRAAAGEKNIWLMGGGELVGQFYDAGLLDELIVQIAPVTLGAGAPLLPRAIATPPLRLVSAQTLNEALVELRYEIPK